MSEEQTKQELLWERFMNNFLSIEAYILVMFTEEIITEASRSVILKELEQMRESFKTIAFLPSM